MDINNFGPFASDVWGDFSSFITMLATGFGLRYIIKTFRSQQQVQREQQAITLMEQERFKNEIPVVFKSHDANADFTSTLFEEDGRRNVSFSLTNVGEITVYDVKFKINKTYWNVQEPYLTIKTFEPGQSTPVLFIARFPILDVRRDPTNIVYEDACYIEIYYRDIRRTKFRHVVYYDAADRGRFPMGRPAGIMKDYSVDRPTLDQLFKPDPE
jgi:hypothetical protein